MSDYRKLFIAILASVFVSLCILGVMLYALSRPQVIGATAQAYNKYHTFHASAVTNTNGTAMGTVGLAIVSVQVEGITTTTVTFQATDDGATWYAVEALNKNDGSKATSTATDGYFAVPVLGANQLRCPISGYASGTITVTGKGESVGAFALANMIVLGYDGSNYQIPRIDKSTLAYEIISHSEGEIHSGDAFAIHVYDDDWDDGDTMNIAFTTADSTEWLHIIPSVGATAVTTFTIQRGCTVTAGSGSAYLARNRNENAAGVITSTVSSLAASPVVGEVSLNVTITAQGFFLHEEVLGADKTQGGHSDGVRDKDEYVLKQNTTYCFVMENTGAGADNMIASMELSWYEHVDLVASW